MVAKVEFRADGAVTIDGYVNVTDRLSRPIKDGNGGYFLEKIQAGAFQRALDRAGKVNILLNHDWNKKIGDTDTNLDLKEDVIGLKVHANLDDEEVLEEAKKQNFKGWSFDIQNPVDSFSEENGMKVRTIKDFDISEISLITDMLPYYNSTTVEVRGDKSVELRSELTPYEYVTKKENFKNKELLKKLIKKVEGDLNEKK